MSKVECVCAVGAQLGEGPVWSAHDQSVWFVDIKGRRIHRYDTRGGALLTTAWKGLSNEQIAGQPLAGGLFAVRVDTPGVAVNEVRYDG